MNEEQLALRKQAEELKKSIISTSKGMISDSETAISTRKLLKDISKYVNFRDDDENHK